MQTQPGVSRTPVRVPNIFSLSTSIACGAQYYFDAKPSSEFLIGAVTGALCDLGSQWVGRLRDADLCQDPSESNEFQLVDS